MKRHRCARIILLVLLVWGTAFADGYILRTHQASDYPTVAARWGLTLVNTLSVEDGVFLVQAPPGAVTPQALMTDPLVLEAETDAALILPEFSAGAPVKPAGNPVPAPLGVDIQNKGSSFYYTSSVWSQYLTQPAAAIIRNPAYPFFQFTNGFGAVVAVIDTGVDFSNSVLAPSLMAYPGYDFTRSRLSGQEETDILSQSTTEVLDQSTTEVLDGGSVMILNQSTTEVLDQSTTEVLDMNGAPLRAFGHGTMIAGLVHLVAPLAQIMPLKAFSADGSATLSNIVAAIYFAVDHGADVINMSFDSISDSQALRAAVQYADLHNVICVASVGNDGEKTSQIFPAAYSQVIGVASTNDFDVRSLFSNYGDSLVTVAAPGEGVVSTYPFNHWAAGWGTSFSAPLVAGGAALLVQLNPGIRGNGAAAAFQQGAKDMPGQGLGGGRIDLQNTIDSLLDRQGGKGQ